MGYNRMEKTNEDVYVEIADRQKSIAKKSLDMKQHAVYIPIPLFEEVLALSNKDSRSFNREVEFLMRLGLQVYKGMPTTEIA